MSKDEIFANEGFAAEPFRFNAAVADVFPDMLERSIPGYRASLEAIGSLAARYVTAGSACYDLGCSLGAAALAMRQAIRAPATRIVAVDNSEAMIERCRKIVAAEVASAPHGPGVTLVLSDVRDIAVEDASMVVLNYTLQFVPPKARDELLAGIARGLRPGGLLILGEKVVDEDPHMEALLVNLYHEHKRRNDYSALEIASKRTALENVLVPETVSTHRSRLEAAGFGKVAIWFRYFNFVSILAIKP